MYMKVFWFNDKHLFNGFIEKDVNAWIDSVKGQYKVMNISAPQLTILNSIDQYFVVTVVYVER
jgi:hypothetical protein